MDNDRSTLPVLGGSVALIDVMGDDQAIVDAARVSYLTGTKSYRSDTALIHYLMRNKHWSPFEMVEFKFRIECPLFVARQIFRHRTASVNEISGRYSEIEEHFYTPDADQLLGPCKVNKQGGAEPLPEEQAKLIHQRMVEGAEETFSEYKTFLKAGLSREQARMNLPLSTYTVFYWKQNLRNLFNLLQQRLDSHAQKETQLYAQAIQKFVRENNPIAYAAFEEHILDAITISSKQWKKIKAITRVSNASVETVVLEYFTGSEREELKRKLL